MEIKPILKIGVLGDIQGLPARHDWGMSNFARATEILKSRNVNVLLSLGDTAEGGNPDTYKLYWEILEENFGKDGITHIACEGNHDLGNKNLNNFTEAFQRACAGIKQPAQLLYHKNVSGIDFISFAEDEVGKYSKESCQQLRSFLEQFSADKPLFLLTHYPPAKTMAGSSDKSGIQNLRDVLNDFPQVISLSGHTHWPLEDDQYLWQGNFTAITASSLSYGFMRGDYFNSLSGLIPYGREAIQILYMELYADCLKIERIHVLDNRTIGNIDKVYLPYSPENKIYSTPSSQPRFPENARLLVRYDFGYMYLGFDRPEGIDTLYLDVEIIPANPENGKTQTIRYVNEFYRQQVNRAGMMFIKLPGDGMIDDADYIIKLYPVNTWETRGEPLEIKEHTWKGYTFKDGALLYPQE